MLVTTTHPLDEPQGSAAPQIYALELTASLNEILSRRPSVGLALGVVRGGRLEFFHGHGLANIASNTPITEDTSFRIGSITKTFTAIAVMQLCEQGLIDLDAPANDHLRAYKLSPTRDGFRPATVRHLLTHTAGIPEVVHVSDLFHPDWGPFGSRPVLHSVRLGEPLPSLAAYYGGALRVVTEPGTAFAYTNHGFATLGQIVEDVSGQPLDAYLREHVFAPLGMTDTDLVRSERIRPRLATGYELGPGGATPITDRDWIGGAGGGAYSSGRDLARFVAALLGGGANEHGSILRTATLATMFEPQYQSDPRLPGIGLSFDRGEAGGHRVVGKDGILPGFNSMLLVAPDDGVGLFVLTNGSSGAMAWLPIELERLLRRLLHLPDDPVRGDVPHHPEIWADLCGRYQLPPRVSDLRGRLAMGGGAQVFVRGGRLMVRLLTPIPALYRGFPLIPDDPQDPFAFRLDLSTFGMPIVRVVFSREPGRGITAVHTDLQWLSFYKRRVVSGGRARAAAALGALAVVTAATAVRRRRTHGQGAST
jgi:CubicO group peptidase (beta-lactamase class C family)